MSFFKYLKSSLCKQKTVGIFVDAPNMIRKSQKIDLLEVKRKAEKYGKIVIGNVYLDQYAPEKLIEAVINQGFTPIVSTGDVDVAMATDIVYYTLSKPLDVTVIVSRDTDFVPAASRIKEFGAKVVLFTIKSAHSKALEHHVDEVVEFR